jgi:hypothetical protein
MNLFTKIFYLSCIAFIPNIYAQECEAKLFITCDIQNVEILVDGNLVVNGKSYEGVIAEGQHSITVSENSDRWAAAVFRDTINVTSCDDIHLRYNFKSHVLLKSDPGDATVFAGDSLIGYTPLFIHQGINRLRLEKNGYESKMISYSDIGPDKNVQLDFIGEIDNESFVDKPLFKILAGSMFVLGAVTAYYKLEADDSFEEYGITGDQALLDRTERFDTISGITFAAFQINFAALLYLILVD